MLQGNEVSLKTKTSESCPQARQLSEMIDGAEKFLSRGQMGTGGPGVDVEKGRKAKMQQARNSHVFTCCLDFLSSFSHFQICPSLLIDKIKGTT